MTNITFELKQHFVSKDTFFKMREVKGMKALSVRQPWADLIVSGHKDCENRTRPTNFRGTILIHASKTVDKYAMQQIGICADAMRCGGIIGSGEIVDCGQNIDSDWYEQGGYGWMLRNAIDFKHCLHCQGKLAFFTPSFDHITGYMDGSAFNLVFEDV